MLRWQMHHECALTVTSCCVLAVTSQAHSVSALRPHSDAARCKQSNPRSPVVQRSHNCHRPQLCRRASGRPHLHKRASRRRRPGDSSLAAAWLQACQHMAGMGSRLPHPCLPLPHCSRLLCLNIMRCRYWAFCSCFALACALTAHGCLHRHLACVKMN